MSDIYDDEVDDEAAARFWGAPRFGTASSSAGGHSAAQRAASSGAYSGRGEGATNGNNDIKDDRADDYDDDVDDDEESFFESEPEPVAFPESTHTILFMFPICSYPFAFAFIIAVISVACLIMSLLDVLSAASPGNAMGVPANVSIQVKAAQYLGIFIALLMEEEIPTALQLLRTIPYSAFKAEFPNQSYNRFVFSAILRILVGLLFLVNAYIILVQSESVLDIFFNVLALQFISELDDIAFSLCKMDVLGRTLRRACTARLYQTEFEKKKFKRNSIASFLIKSVYILELAGFLFGLILITIRQNDGYYQCQEITVDFGDGIWLDPVVVGPDGVDLAATFGYQTLIFSYFNGVYKQLNKETSNGRPVYTEMKKFDSTEFDDIGVLSIMPAKIKYSDDLGCWVFTHPYIKQQEGMGDNEVWMLRSPQTEDYELQSVDGDWDIWLGRIESTRVKISCNKCNDNTDCNLNGVCGEEEEGECKCNAIENTTYLGTHCEIKLENECTTIINEESTIIYSITKTPQGRLFQEYNRPVYVHISGFPGIKEGDIEWLMYTGRRWFGLGFNLIELNATLEDIYAPVQNFHAFWSNAYSESTKFVSDPTTGDNPVGVDFYIKGETNNATTNQYGPFGVLYPLQKDGIEGRGLWRCGGPIEELNLTEFESKQKPLVDEGNLTTSD